MQRGKLRNANSQWQVVVEQQEQEPQSFLMWPSLGRKEWECGGYQFRAVQDPQSLDSQSSATAQPLYLTTTGKFCSLQYLHVQTENLGRAEIPCELSGFFLFPSSWDLFCSFLPAEKSHPGGKVRTKDLNPSCSLRGRLGRYKTLPVFLHLGVVSHVSHEAFSNSCGLMDMLISQVGEDHEGPLLAFV